jgi:NAD(P)-dependent dehydrogenase (short-subunit alcohol dehydrogenase family)
MADYSYLDRLFSLSGKTVLLTGATGGIGRALAHGLAGAGADLVLADLSQPALDELAAALPGGPHLPVILDVCATSAIEASLAAILSQRKQIDVLINCAGINKREGLLDVTEETYDRIMAVNLKGVFFLTQAVVRQSMIKTGGRIINIGSFNCTSMLGGVSVYGASKSGIAALTRSMAIEWARFNITANCIAPGHILTQLTVPTWEHPQRSAYLKERIALGRPGMPDEVVGLAILLASDASSYMTGQLYNIDGGALAGGKPWPFDTAY